MTYAREDNSSPVPRPRGPGLTRPHPRFAGLSRSAVALFRVGTYRARVAAALLIVAGSLLYQTGAQALEQSSKKVLYLDAPSVSVPRAERAGETARGYAGPDSRVNEAVLAWVGVEPVPREARKAFASITDPGEQPPDGISYDDAVAAGDVMVAQLGEDIPGDTPGDTPGDDAGEDEELASAEPVRPRLGDGTKVADDPAQGGVAKEPTPGAATPAREPQQPEYAASPAPSDVGLPASMAEEYAPPEPPAEQPSDNGTGELAAVPESGPEGVGGGPGSDDTSDIGPISDDYSPEDDSSRNAAPDSPEEAEGAAPDGAEIGSPEAAVPDPQEDDPGDGASPTIVVPDSGTPDEEPEPEYAEAQEGSGAGSANSEVPEAENAGQPPDEPSSEPSPASTAQQPVPAQDTSPGTDEPEPEESSDLVAIVPYDSGAEESQDEIPAGQDDGGQEPSPQPPTEPSTGPPSETLASSPEPDQQGGPLEPAATTPAPAEEESTEARLAHQPHTGSDAELGAGEGPDVEEDWGTAEELPEGVQIRASDEAGVQELSVVVHRESSATDTPGDAPAGASTEDAPESQAEPGSAPPEPAPPAQAGTERPPEGSQGSGDQPSSSTGDGQSPEVGNEAPQSDNSGQPDADRPDDHTEAGRNAGGDSPAPQQVPEDQQQPAPQTSSGPPAGREQDEPEATTTPGAGDEPNKPRTAPADQGQQGDQQSRPADQHQLSGRESQTSAPAPARDPKDEAPRQSTEGKTRGAPANSEARDPTRRRAANQGEQRSPGPEQQLPSQPAREPRQSTSPAKASPGGQGIESRRTGAQGPTQSAGAVQISARSAPQTEPQAEPAPVQDSQPTTQSATTNPQQSNQAAPELQHQPAATWELEARRAARSAEVSAQRQAALEAAPEVAPETAPAAPSSVEPATAEVADPAGWVDQARAARQANQVASQIPAQPLDTAARPYVEPTFEQGWDQTAQQATETAPGQWPDVVAPTQDYPAEQDIGVQIAEVVDGVDSYTQEAVGSASGTTIPTGDTADPYADSYAEPSTEPSTEDAATNYEAPVAQEAAAPVEGVAQDGYSQDAVEPYAEDVAASAAPASQPATYEDPAPAGTYTETYTEPATRVSAQQLEPAQQVPTQQLEPAPQVADVLESEPAVAPPSAASAAPSPAPSPAPAQQQVVSAVDTAIQKTTSGGGGQ